MPDLEGKESTIGNILFEIILALLVAIVVEPTIKALNLDRLIPYVPYFWLLVFVAFTSRVLWRWRRLRYWAPRFYASLPRGKKIMSYAVVGAIGASVFVGYWWAINTAFSKRESAPSPMNERPELSRDTSGERKPIPQEPPKPQTSKQPHIDTTGIKSKKPETPKPESAIPKQQPRTVPNNAPSAQQPTAIIQTAPELGNLKERAVALSQEIMEDLYNHGWREGDPRVPHVMPPIEHMKMPPAGTLKEMEDWNQRRSNKFRYRYLERAIGIRNELFQLHLQDGSFDAYLQEAGAAKQSDGQLQFEPQRVPAFPILPQAIEEVYRELIVLANQLK
ncbi:MAG: hypothetical protein ABSF45_12910 [Terriglobia bacterium]|jgi:hypothetical protein